MRHWRNANRERYNTYMRRWRSAHPDAYRESKRKNYMANRDRIRSAKVAKMINELPDDQFVRDIMTSLFHIRSEAKREIYSQLRDR